MEVRQHLALERREVDRQGIRARPLGDTPADFADCIRAGTGHEQVVKIEDIPGLGLASTRQRADLLAERRGCIIVAAS